VYLVPGPTSRPLQCAYATPRGIVSGCGGWVRRVVETRVTCGVHDFRRLQVWQSSRELVVALHPFLRRFPRDDRGVLASQLRRAALSIPSCIAEGCGAGSRAETVRFLKMASRSACETESHLQLACDLHFIPPKPAEQLLANTKSIQRMLTRLIDRIPN